jgi:hypothetical protein
MASVAPEASGRLALPERLLRNVLSNSAAAALGAAAQLAGILVAGRTLDTAAYAAYLVAIALVGVAYGRRSSSPWARRRGACFATPWRSRRPIPR